MSIEPTRRIACWPAGRASDLDSEVIRDQILDISGLLNNTMYGKSVKPPQPADLWRDRFDGLIIDLFVQRRHGR